MMLSTLRRLWSSCFTVSKGCHDELNARLPEQNESALFWKEPKRSRHTKGKETSRTSNKRSQRSSQKKSVCQTRTPDREKAFAPAQMQTTMDLSDRPGKASSSSSSADRKQKKQRSKSRSSTKMARPTPATLTQLIETGILPLPEGGKYIVIEAPLDVDVMNFMSCEAVCEGPQKAEDLIVDVGIGREIENGKLKRQSLISGLSFHCPHCVSLTTKLFYLLCSTILRMLHCTACIFLVQISLNQVTLRQSAAKENQVRRLAQMRKTKMPVNFPSKKNFFSMF